MTPTENTPPDTTSPRVDRGGGWYVNGASRVRVASRYTNVPALRNYGFGFRTALAGRMRR